MSEHLPFDNDNFVYVYPITCNRDEDTLWSIADMLWLSGIWTLPERKLCFDTFMYRQQTTTSRKMDMIDQIVADRVYREQRILDAKKAKLEHYLNTLK